MAGEVDVAPVQRHELPSAQTGVGSNTHELGVLNILARPGLDFPLAECGTRRVAVGAGGERTSELLDLFRGVEDENRALRLCARSAWVAGFTSSP